MQEIAKKVADFFQEMDNTLKSPLDSAMFMQAISASVGVFFHNNYEHPAHAEMADLFRKVILEIAEELRRDKTSAPHIHVIVNIQDRKK